MTTPTVRYCYCKREGLDRHKAGCRYAGRMVKYDTGPRRERVDEHDDASMKMERRYDHLDGDR